MDLAWAATPAAIVLAGLSCALLYLLWIARSGPSSGSGVAGAMLDLVSLPVGAFAFAVAILTYLDDHLTIAIPLVLGLAGAVLIGRSLRELPWMGLVSAGLGFGAAYAVDRFVPSASSVPALVLVGVVGFVLAYLILSLVSGPFRLLAWGTTPRFVSAILAVAAAAVGVAEAILSGLV